SSPRHTSVRRSGSPYLRTKGTALPKILLVDDDSGIREVVTYALQREGFEIDAAAVGEAALEQARADAYDVVILDVMLPAMSGIDVCRELRAESNVPILMLTAKDAEV